MKIKVLLLVPVFVAVLALGAAAQYSSSPKTAGGNQSGPRSVEAYPEIELAAGFSFLCACPHIGYFNRFYFLGGGGAAVYNIRSWIGVKGEFMGYTTSGGFTNQFRHLGAVSAGNGNLFTYTFGPQVKKQWGKFRPFGEFLVGGAHSNAYAKIFSIQTARINSSENAFAMQFGAGLDIPLNDRIQIRPVEFDCLYTRFSATGLPIYGGSQHSYKYVGGVNFTFGRRTR